MVCYGAMPGSTNHDLAARKTQHLGTQQRGSTVHLIWVTFALQFMSVILKRQFFEWTKVAFCFHGTFNAILPLNLLLYTASVLNFIDDFYFNQAERMIQATGCHNLSLTATIKDQSLKHPTVSKAYHRTNCLHGNMALCTTRNGWGHSTKICWGPRKEISASASLTE